MSNSRARRNAATLDRGVPEMVELGTTLEPPASAFDPFGDAAPPPAALEPSAPLGPPLAPSGSLVVCTSALVTKVVPGGAQQLAPGRSKSDHAGSETSKPKRPPRHA